MRRDALVSAAVLFVLLATLGAVAQQPSRAFTPSTYGTADFGYKAAFDLLRESGVAVERNLAPFRDLPAASTVWWLGGGSLCGPAECGEGDPDCRADAAPAWTGADWLARGGTAVVFLSVSSPCAAVAGLTLPGRPATSARLDSTSGPTGLSSVEGTALSRPRTLSAVDAFADAGDWKVGASADGRPFVLERNVGAGRVVIVGDSRFLANAELDRADAAPLVMDLVRTYGPPLFDERDHGFGATRGTTAYLVRSPALGVFVGLALLGVGLAWWGAAMPPRPAEVAAAPAPTLESYVDSLATLYSRARDYSAVAVRYRDFITSQLRRRLGLAPDTPATVLLETLTRQRRLTEADVRLLRDEPAVTSSAQLRQLAAALDDLQRKATR